MKIVRMAGVVAATALALGACGEAPTKEAAPGAGKKTDFTACMVSDSGGIDDKSFNQTSYKGIEDAEKELGVTSKFLESKSDNDYTANVDAMVSQDCGVIVTVGFKLDQATRAAAEGNKEEKFAIVDFVHDPAIENVRPLVFNTNESSFLAGYLAAGMSKSGTVGTFGGAPIPTVQIFMDGYAAGVGHYNKTKGKNVEVVGWNRSSGKGLFTGDFEKKDVGAQNAQNLITQGADIVFPVAGPAGLGALEAAKQSNGKVNAIWVDTDGCVSAAEYCSVLLTSVFKGMDVAVKDAVKDAVDGAFTNEKYVGTLENGGTGLTPFHEFESKIPQELRTELDQLKKDISAGKVDASSKYAF